MANPFAGVTQPAVGDMPIGEDPISGAMNMPAFAQSFAQMTFGEPLEHAALWYIDIRGFRSINPKFGFFAGNMVLRTVADGVRKHLSGDLPITRLGGDRFVFVSAHKGLEECDEAFHKLVKEVNDTIAENGVSSRVSLVGGMYFLREEDYERHDHRRALDYASIAHRNAQNDPHSSLVNFTDEDLERDTRRIIIEQSIDQALKDGQIEVWYQPQVDYTYGEVVGAEALARWNHPDLGWISPAEFVPVLENCGRVHDLDLFIWERACRDAGKWRAAADGNPVPISVNVSRTEMFEEGLLDHFKELQKKYNLPNGSLHLEVTESAFVEETERLYHIIEAMRANNMVVEMDDFGSGLSSLNMLKDVPVDVVKLDMGFVRAGVNEERGGVVLGSVIRMLQGLDTPIIAEGVETLEQAEMLKNMGCHLMQGFHFSRPMPLDEFESFVNTNTAVDNADRRMRKESHLEDLMSFDRESSYLFNQAIGGTMFFFTRDRSSESILVNDLFYKECGLNRDDFGSKKVNPIDEIAEGSRESMWRSASEAREKGSALCTARVRRTNRWFEGVIRFLGTSARGDIFSLTISRSGEMDDSALANAQMLQDFEWDLTLLDRIMPNGFVKCELNSDLTIEYISHKLIEASELPMDIFKRRFHKSFIEVVSVHDRTRFVEHVQESAETGDPFQCEVCLYHGFGGRMRAGVIGRVAADSSGKRWVYMAVLLYGEIEEGDETDSDVLFDRVVPFDYHMADDRLVIHAPLPDGSVRDMVMENWLEQLDKLPDNIDPASAAKILATVSDLRHHPLTGFTDLKCNLRGGNEMRWYHINYICDSDEEGNTTVLHGFAHDANDEMGSAKWWRKQAEIDQLTGLLNRNAAEQEINLSIRTHGAGMMFMIDLDDFKRVNDELGHLVGDELLRQVGKSLAGHFREGDVLGRYGGDEFVAFMPVSASPDTFYQLAERRGNDIVEAISKLDIPDGTHPGCSVGVALTLDRSNSFYDLLEVADRAMYASKLVGKGSVTITRM